MLDIRGSLCVQDGCPVNSGSSLNRTIVLKPLAQNCSGMRGLCLDAALSKVTDESNLASSSLADTGNQNDLLGVVISYTIKVKLILSGMGGEMDCDLPFKLVHPRPGSTFENVSILKAISCYPSESDLSKKLESEKKTAMSKNDKKRKKFQAQDSVLKESINASQARENPDTL